MLTSLLLYASCVQSNPALRRMFMIKTAHGGWRLPHTGELCCKRPALATTLENSEYTNTYIHQLYVYTGLCMYTSMRMYRCILTQCLSLLCISCVIYTTDSIYSLYGRLKTRCSMQTFQQNGHKGVSSFKPSCKSHVCCYLLLPCSCCSGSWLPLPA